MLDALEAEPDPPTTIRDRGRAREEHLDDSLSGLKVPALAAARAVADIGSGVGFPGLALAAALADARVDLVESGRRKCEGIERLVAAAGLDNARALALRAEELAAGEGREAYDVVTARALAPLAVLLEYASPLLRDGGALVAWKGARAAAEEEDAARAAGRLAMEPGELLAVRPFPAARDRHLHVWHKRGATPAGLPRRPGMASKRPFGGEGSPSGRGRA